MLPLLWTQPDVPLAAIAKTVYGPNLRGIYSGGAYLNPELAQAYVAMVVPIAQGFVAAADHCVCKKMRRKPQSALLMRRKLLASHKTIAA